MEKELAEAHPKHVASILRSDAAAWIGAITLWLYLGAILTTHGYLAVFRASPEWFDLTVFQLTTFSMFPLFGATIAAIGYCVFMTSRGSEPQAIFGYLVWSLPAAITYAFIDFSSNRYNSGRIDSRWGRYGMAATLAVSLIAPLVLHFRTTRVRRRDLRRLDEAEDKCKSVEAEIAKTAENCGQIEVKGDSFASSDSESARQALESSESRNRELLAWRQRIEEIRHLRSILERATPKEMWVAITVSAFLTLSYCYSIGSAWALLATSDPPVAVNVATGVTEEILLTDGERSLVRMVVEGNEEVVYRAGDREWVLRMRDGQIPAPTTRTSKSPTPKN